VIDARRGIAHLVAHEPDAIVSRIRLELIYRCTCPSFNGRLHSHGLANRGKCEEARCAVNKELMVGSVVIHVALPGMSLAPGVFMRSNISGFGEIDRALIHCCVQVIDLHKDPVRYAIMGMAAVVVRGRWKIASEGINPGTRSDLVLRAI